MSRKIAIIGAGADAVINLVQLISHRDTLNSVYQDDEITWIRDCSHQVPNFGVQTNPIWVTTLAATTTVNSIDYYKRFDAVQKLGMKFVGIGNRRDSNFFVLFDPTELGMHFDEGKFVDFFWENIKNQHRNVNLVDKRVESVTFDDEGAYLDGVPYDFVIDCVKGALWDKDAYKSSLFNPTDTKLTVNRKIPGDWDYTVHVACEHGYLTGIPTQDAQTWIYSYDSGITTEEEAVEDFNKHCAVKKHCSYRKNETDHNVSEYMIHPNNKYARSGRALGLNDDFTGLNSYSEADAADALGEYLFFDQERPQSNFHRLEVEERWKETQLDQATGLAFFMQFGSQYKSKFWEQSRVAACKLLEDKEIHQHERSEVYDKLSKIPYHENIRLDYFRRQLEDEKDLRTRMSADSEEPYKIIGNYQNFYQIAHGLGAPYASKYPALSPMWDPPEKFGEIKLDPIFGGRFKKQHKKK